MIINKITSVLTFHFTFFLHITLYDNKQINLAIRDFYAGFHFPVLEKFTQRTSGNLYNAYATKFEKISNYFSSWYILKLPLEVYQNNYNNCIFFKLCCVLKSVFIYLIYKQHKNVNKQLIRSCVVPPESVCQHWYQEGKLIAYLQK